MSSCNANHNKLSGLPLNCPKCGKEIKDENAIYCPHCSKRLVESASRKTGFPIASDVLVIIAACFSIAPAKFGWDRVRYWLVTPPRYYNEYYATADYLMLAAGIAGFVLGLVGGIVALKRRKFALSIVGSAILTFSGLLVTIAFGINDLARFAVLFGMPIFIPGLLSLILTAISKNEFS